MTGAQTLIYTAAIALSTLGAGAVIAHWVIPQPMIQGSSLTLVIGGAVAAWLTFAAQIVEDHRTVRAAEKDRRAKAAEYTDLGGAVG